MNPVPPEIVTQLLHRTVASVGVITVFGLTFANWILAHLATEWVMPPELVTTGQAAISSLVTLLIFNAAIKRYGLAAAQAINGAAPETAAKAEGPKP